LNTDILDAKIRKLGKKTAKVYDYLARECYFLFDIPPTSVKFNSKDIASFRMHKRPNPDEMQECCRIALMYAEGMSTDKIAKTFDPPKARNYITRSLKKHLKHTSSYLLQKTDVVREG